MRLGLLGRGRLGRAIADVARDQVTWQVGRQPPPRIAVDVAIDASIAEAVPAHLDWALSAGVDLVIAATGWSLPDLDDRVQGRIGVLVAPNLSLGALLLRQLSVQIGRFAAGDPERDLSLLEHHHRYKADSPSGTARALADLLVGLCPTKRTWTTAPPKPDEIGIAVIRRGAEIGRHTVAVDAPGETLEITHRVATRAVFAHGALAAAHFLHGRRGVFGLDDLAAALLTPQNP